VDIDEIAYERFFARRPILIVNEAGVLARRINFLGSPPFTRENFEVSGYAQDRWSASDRLLLELGLRLDWDQIVRQTLVSPRFAAAYLLTKEGNTKITAGAGLFYDATNLDFITSPLTGQRLDFLYATGMQQTLETSFKVNEANLKAPRFLNWS